MDILRTKGAASIGLRGQGDESETIDAYSEFIATVDTVFMGWNTYHQIVTELSPQEWVYDDLMTYVFTHRSCNSLKNVQFVSAKPVEFAKKLKKEKGRDIWICGGASLAQQFIREDFIDYYHITVIPTILGSGVRLFDTAQREIKLQLVRSRSYNGMTDLIYTKREIINGGM